MRTKRGRSLPPARNLPPALTDLQSDSAARLYRIAFDEGRRSIADQAEELTGVRSRAVSYMAFIGTATAFLVTTTLKAVTPDLSFYIVAGIATLSVSWATLQLCRVIWPNTKFTLRMDPIVIIELFIDKKIPTYSDAEIYRELSKWFGRYLDTNERSLVKIRKLFAHVILFGGGGLVMWTIAVWMFAVVGTHA